MHVSLALICMNPFSQSGIWRVMVAAAVALAPAQAGTMRMIFIGMSRMRMENRMVDWGLMCFCMPGEEQVWTPLRDGHFSDLEVPLPM
jgi:hypothetical protein